MERTKEFETAEDPHNVEATVSERDQPQNMQRILSGSEKSS
jgi:hypothetical protein